MNKSRKIPELLAPAGNPTALAAAIQAGCDAVYLGLRQFNMRGAPTNFTIPQLKAAAKKCRDNGVKLYVTVNTIIYTQELNKLNKCLDAIKDHADAVICWDLAVIQACLKRHIPVHISTQASVANAEAAKFYRDLGAERIVLARECTLKEIVNIRKKAGIPIEVFAHGAQCVSVSGRCFLSQDTLGLSGNRGVCRQNCRRPYRVICQDGPGDFEVFPNDNHVFSAKDLCTIPFIDKLLDAGIDSLKIEGRNRPPDYVFTIVDAYRNAIDDWKNNALTTQRKEQLINQCKQVFNREFSDGFFLGRPIQDFTRIENNAATQKRTLVGKIINYYQKSKIARLWLQNGTIGDQEELVIMGPTTGIVKCQVEHFIKENDPKLAPQATATFKCEQKVRANDQVYKIIPADAP